MNSIQVNSDTGGPGLHLRCHKKKGNVGLMPKDPVMILPGKFSWPTASQNNDIPK